MSVSSLILITPEGLWGAVSISSAWRQGPSESQEGHCLPSRLLSLLGAGVWGALVGSSPSVALVCQAPLGAGRTLASSGHGLFCSPHTHPHPTHPPTPRQKGKQENTGKCQERGACELARNFISGPEVCSEALHIQAELPPCLEWLLIFNTEVCGFTIGPSRQSQRASPRQRVWPDRKNTRCGCQPGMLVNDYQPALPGGVGVGEGPRRGPGPGAGPGGTQWFSRPPHSARVPWHPSWFPAGLASSGAAPVPSTPDPLTACSLPPPGKVWHR